MNGCEDVFEEPIFGIFDWSGTEQYESKLVWCLNISIEILTGEEKAFNSKPVVRHSFMIQKQHSV